jgi:hypothetical protein
MRARYVGSVVTLFAVVASITADDRSGIQSFEDNRDHWLFEFDIASKKPLGNRDDVASITALVTLEAQRTVKGAHAGATIIQWVSSASAITKTQVTGAAPMRQLLCVCEKRESGWQLLYVYRFPPPSLLPQKPNQTMKPTAPLRYNFSVFATDPARGLSLSR